MATATLQIPNSETIRSQLRARMDEVRALRKLLKYATAAEVAAAAAAERAAVGCDQNERLAQCR